MAILPYEQSTPESGCGGFPSPSEDDPPTTPPRAFVGGAISFGANESNSGSNRITNVSLFRIPARTALVGPNGVEMSSTYLTREYE